MGACRGRVQQEQEQQSWACRRAWPLYHGNARFRFRSCAQAATPEVLAFLKKLRGHVFTGMVGGSDLAKQREQLGEDGEHAKREPASHAHQLPLVFGSHGRPLVGMVL